MLHFRFSELMMMNKRMKEECIYVEGWVGGRQQNVHFLHN